jgi:hypothetical protein
MTSAQIDDTKSKLPDCVLNPAEREKGRMSESGYNSPYAKGVYVRT